MIIEVTKTLTDIIGTHTKGKLPLPSKTCATPILVMGSVMGLSGNARIAQMVYAHAYQARNLQCKYVSKER